MRLDTFDNLVGTSEIARVLKVRPTTVYHWKCTGRYPELGLRSGFGHRIVTTREQLMKFAEGYLGVSMDEADGSAGEDTTEESVVK